MVTQAAPSISADGRGARAARTRDSVVEALLSLIEEGHLRPTAKQVSDRAGVSLRSVFQHFADLESLFATAADLQVERISKMITPVDPNAPFEERLTRFVEARSRMLERITPIRRAALLHEPFSAEIARRLAWARDTALNEVAAVFSRELGSPPKDSALAALRACTDWYTWETLRTHHGLPVSDSRKVMSRMLRALLQKED